MGDDAFQALDEVYRLKQNSEWAFFLDHLRFTRGFGLFVLLAPEHAGVEVCQRALGASLAEGQKSLHRIDLRLEDHPAVLGDTLLRLQPGEEVGAVWISGPEVRNVLDPAPVKLAWHHTLAALNSRRNPLRDRLALPLIFAGPFWLQEIMRAAAPDLWSIRDTVARIEPEARPLLTGGMALEGVSGFSDEDSDETSSVEEIREALARVGEKRGTEPLRAELLRRLGVKLDAEGKWEEAEAALLRASEIIEQNHGSYLEQWRIQMALAGHFHLCGDARRMEHYARSAYELSNRHFGPMHQNTLDGRNALAIALRAQGKHAEAEAENRAVLAIQELALGADHPSTLVSRNNLATALYSQGKHAEAEAEHRAVSAIWQRVLGAEHPNTLVSRHNLASALEAQGKHAEAEREHRAVLTIRERVLGKEHPDVFRSCFNLAITQWAVGNLRGAASFAQRAAAGLNRVLGAEHPYTRAAEGLVRELKADLTS